MRISIEMGLVSNKIIIIQALALMSQFSDNPVGEDISSQLCGRAVQHVQSLGLHVKGQQEEHRDRCSTTLLCCIWAIDRMNAAFNGCPVLMHERDSRKDLEQCFEQQDPCFRVFLKVIELLDKVIDLYRPLPTSGDQPGLNWDFPAFEDVVISCSGSQVSTSALGERFPLDDCTQTPKYDEILIYISHNRNTLPCNCDSIMPLEKLGGPGTLINVISPPKPFNLDLELHRHT